LYSKDFDTFAPPIVNGISYDAVLPLSLLPYHKITKDTSDMKLELRYSTPARELWRLRTFAVVQREYSYDRVNRWTKTDVL
jgi:hypothetical protein